MKRFYRVKEIDIPAHFARRSDGSRRQVFAIEECRVVARCDDEDDANRVLKALQEKSNDD